MKTAMLQVQGATLTGDGIFRKWINGQKKFAAIIDGDNLIIKKTRSLLDFAGPADGHQMTPEEVSVETHRARKR